MHKLPGPFYNIRNRKLETKDHDDYTHVSTISVTATASFPNPDGYTSSLSATRLCSKLSILPQPSILTSSPLLFSGIDIDYPHFSTLGQPF